MAEHGHLCAWSLLRGAGLAQMATTEHVEVPHRLLLALEECLEEVRFGGRHGVRPHCHGLDVFLERFGLLKCALDGVVIDLLSINNLCDFLVVQPLGLLLQVVRLGRPPPWQRGQRCPWTTMPLARTAFCVISSATGPAFAASDPVTCDGIHDLLV